RRSRALADASGSVGERKGHLHLDEGSASLQHRSAGDCRVNLRRVACADEVTRLGIGGGSQSDSRGDVRADLRPHGPGGTLRRKHQVDAERTTLCREAGELRKEVPIRGGDLLELVDDHDEPWWPAAVPFVEGGGSRSSGRRLALSELRAER